MSSASTVTAIVPGTTANLGPGFDCLGAALNLYNRFRFAIAPRGNPGDVRITATGKEAARVSADKSNLAYRSFRAVYDRIGRETPPVEIEIDLGVPLARGLGSSATAIVGGIVGANELVGKPLGLSAVLELAAEIEGHPDNVAPAIAGGCCLAVPEATGKWHLCPIPWHEAIVPVLAVPDFELSTEESRRVLPDRYSRADAIFNVARLGLLLQAIAAGREDWLRDALHDRIHQPYRTQLIRGYEEVRGAAIAAGAFGAVISGAGPTILALCDRARSEDVAGAMAETWQQMGVEAEAKVRAIDERGARIEFS